MRTNKKPCVLRDDGEVAVEDKRGEDAPSDMVVGVGEVGIGVNDTGVAVVAAAAAAAAIRDIAVGVERVDSAEPSGSVANKTAWSWVAVRYSTRAVVQPNRKGAVRVTATGVDAGGAVLFTPGGIPVPLDASLG